MDNKKEIIIIVIVIVVQICLILLVRINDNESEETEYHNFYDLAPGYCSRGYCYKYYEDSLDFYGLQEVDDPEEPGEILEYSCIIGEDCKEEIIEVTDQYLIIKKDNIFKKYDNKDNEEYKKIENISLKGKFFANETDELYFLTDKIVILGGKNYNQKKETYVFFNYIGEYLEIGTSYTYVFDHHPYNFIYKVKDDEILGYQKADIADAKYIDKDVYDENGEVIMRDEYLFSGAFKSKDYEMIINKNKATLAYLDLEGEIIRDADLFISDIGREYINFSFKKGNNVFDFIYKRKTQEVCFSDLEDCYHSVDSSELKVLK